MGTQSFRAAPTKRGTKVVLPLPFDPNRVWGERERYHVRGEIAGVFFRGPIQHDAGMYFLSLGPAWLRDAHLALEEETAVTLDVEGPQVEMMPADIAAALAADPQAQRFFESLPTFYRKNFMRWLDSAKRAETRQARIREMVALLAAGRRER
jgi:hypothetical protein